MSELTPTNIPYDEFRAISEITQAHVAEHGDALRTLIAFGRLVAVGDTHDIELLEVVDRWQGPRRVSFGSTPELRLRGRLTLYFLRPDEFENPDDRLLPDSDFSATSLLYRVEDAYTTLLERPARYAQETLRRFNLSPIGPLTFIRGTRTPAEVGV